MVTCGKEFHGHMTQWVKKYGKDFDVMGKTWIYERSAGCFHGVDGLSFGIFFFFHFAGGKIGCPCNMPLPQFRNDTCPRPQSVQGLSLAKACPTTFF